MFLTIKLCTHAKLNCFKLELIIYIKMDLALNNQQKLICHKTPTNNQLAMIYRFIVTHAHIVCVCVCVCVCLCV